MKLITEQMSLIFFEIHGGKDWSIIIRKLEVFNRNVCSTVSINGKKQIVLVILLLRGVYLF